MFLDFDEQPSDSPLVERIWRSRSQRAGTFVSVAANHFEIVLTRCGGDAFMTLRGPETKSSLADCPADGEWVAIRFALGTFMPGLPPGALRDRQDVTLPAASSRAFWLNGSAWEYPTFDNAESFVARLARKGVIAHDPIVDAVVHGRPSGRSARSVERHFLDATGLTPRQAQRIERARHAANLLRDGRSILDVVHDAGYFDQAHLTRSVKALIGQTPGQIRRGEQQLSFLYKTAPPPDVYDPLEGAPRTPGRGRNER